MNSVSGDQEMFDWEAFPMRKLGIIKGDGPHDGLTSERWKKCAARRPGDLQGSERFGRWRIVTADACIGRLDFIEDGGRGEPGYLVVAAAPLHSQSVSVTAEALANELGARFQRCSARFSEIESLVEQ